MDKQANRRRSFSAEFKQEAVRLSEKGEKSIPQLERELGLSRGQLSHWRRQFAEGGESAFDGKVRNETERELMRLRRENARLKEEQDILKKVFRIFSQDA